MVKLVLPYGAGTGTDLSARLLADKLKTIWGQPVIVENRPGGDGLIAMGGFAHAKDDHVLLYTSSGAFAAHPYTHEKLPYSLSADMKPVAQVSRTIAALAVFNRGTPVDLTRFVDHAKSHPGSLNVAAAAGAPEFVMRAFIKANQLDVALVPYREISKAVSDLGEDRIQLVLSSYAVLDPYVQSNKISVVAVTSRERSDLVPGVKTVAELGFPELEVDAYIGLFAPATMPDETVQRISRDIIAVASEESFKKRLAGSAQEPSPGGPAEFADTLRRQATTMERAAEILQLTRSTRQP